MKTLLFNPFEKYSDTILLVSGLIGNSIGVFIFYIFKVRCIGFLKIDYVEESNLLHTIFQNIIIISSLTIILFGLGKIVNQKTRFIDVFNACLMAKIPFYTLGFFNINDVISSSFLELKSLYISQKITEASMVNFPLVLVFSLVSFVILIWAIVLLYNGFKTASNVKETKHKVYFAIAIVIADIISRILINQLKLW
jgi:hypothetical protein